MTQPDDPADQRLHSLLREVGPDVPQPALQDDARARLLASMDSADVPRALEGTDRFARRLKWVAAAGGSMAAVLGLSCILLWTSLGRAREQLALSRWQIDEALQLLINARQTQQSIQAPENVDGLRSSDLVLITFHHDLCPLARPCTPKFKEMAQRHQGEGARFITFDVTGSKREAVKQQIEALGMQFALLGPPGAETGVVKVLDATHLRVLCSAPGAKGLEQAEVLLARVSGGERQP